MTSEDMKQPYQKPALTKRGKLAPVTVPVANHGRMT